MNWLDPILAPLARLAVRNGWLFPQVERRLRQAYVDAAVSAGDGAATDSKISIMTGLQRRDIARLRGATTAPQSHRQPLAEIIALWRDDPAFDPKGLPVKGEGPSFSSLARRVRQDVHPRTFLDVLVESGAVEETGDTVVLKTRSYQPLPGSDNQLAYLADNVGDHLSAAVSNVVANAGQYEMSVHYRHLSDAAITQLHAHYRSRMTEVLEELDTMARAFPEAESGPNRFRAGAYFFDDLPSKDGHRDP